MVSGLVFLFLAPFVPQTALLGVAAPIAALVFALTRHHG